MPDRVSAPCGPGAHTSPSSSTSRALEVAPEEVPPISESCAQDLTDGWWACRCCVALQCRKCGDKESPELRAPDVEYCPCCKKHWSELPPDEEETQSPETVDDGESLSPESVDDGETPSQGEDNSQWEAENVYHRQGRWGRDRQTTGWSASAWQV